MKELLAKLEKATGPDRELDAAIYAFTHGLQWEMRDGQAWVHYVGRDDAQARWHRMWEHPRHGSVSYAPYTGSMDSALALLPKHYLWQVKRGIECCAIVWFLEHDWDDDGAPTGYAATHPALALCIAWAKCHAIEHPAAEHTASERVEGG